PPEASGLPSSNLAGRAARRRAFQAKVLESRTRGSRRRHVVHERKDLVRDEDRIALATGDLAEDSFANQAVHVVPCCGPGDVQQGGGLADRDGWPLKELVDQTDQQRR